MFFFFLKYVLLCQAREAPPDWAAPGEQASLPLSLFVTELQQMESEWKHALCSLEGVYILQ